MLQGAPTTGTKSPCLVPPSLLRATSCSSSVQLWLLLRAFFPVVLLYSPGSGGLLYRRAPHPGVGALHQPTAVQGVT